MSMNKPTASTLLPPEIEIGGVGEILELSYVLSGSVELIETALLSALRADRKFIETSARVFTVLMSEQPGDQSQLKVSFSTASTQSVIVSLQHSFLLDAEECASQTLFWNEFIHQLGSTR